jgi:hypothetical protein
METETRERKANCWTKSTQYSMQVNDLEDPLSAIADIAAPPDQDDDDTDDGDQG